MAQMFGGKSKYLIKNERHNYSAAGVTLIVIILIIFIYILVLKYFTLNPNSILYVIVAFIFIFLILRQIFEQKLSIFDKFNQGRRGEDEICNELKKLPDEYFVFQDITLPNRRGNIDFVVMGSTGLFAIEVKSHSGKIGFNGEELTCNGGIFRENKNFLRQTMREATDLSDYLKQKTSRKYFVIPVIIFSNKWASLKFGFNQIKGVYVLGKPFLHQLIKKNDNNLSQIDVENLKSVMLKI